MQDQRDLDIEHIDPVLVSASIFEPHIFPRSQALSNVKEHQAREDALDRRELALDKRHWTARLGLPRRFAGVSNSFFQLHMSVCSRFMCIG